MSSSAELSAARDLAEPSVVDNPVGRPGIADLPLATMVVSLTGAVLEANRAFCQLLGHPCAPVGMPCRELFAAPGRAELPRVVSDALARSGREDGHNRVDWAAVCMRADGSALGVRTSWQARAARGYGGELEGFLVAVVQPRDEELRQAEHLAASEGRFATLARSVPVGIISARSGLRVDYVNPRCADLFGATVEELLGHGWLDRVHPADQDRVADSVEEILVDGGERALALRVVRSDGTQRQVEARVAPVTGSRGDIGFVGSLEDVTEARASQARLAEMARTDALTSLPNRVAFREALQAALSQGVRSHPALLFIDLDNFKDVNDTFGHSAGDELLRIVAGRLLTVVRAPDLVARLGGDEFVILIESIPSMDAAIEVARRAVEAVARPATIHGEESSITASIGVVWTTEARDAEALVRDADIAMYQAKRLGRNRFARYDESAREAAEQRLSLQSALRRSLDAVPDAGGDLEAGALEVMYQPISSTDGTPVGLEALCRWTHPTLGSMPPHRFIAAAESGRLVADLDRLVLRDALQRVATWRALPGLAHLRVNVNASPLTLDAELVGLAGRLLSDLGLPGRALCIEVTESAVMEDRGAAVDALRQLRDLGIQVAVDDFGTGYSSLAYIQDLPVDILKIDRSFVAGIRDPDHATPIIDAIVTLARDLGLAVVAEGVETEVQQQALTAAGVGMLQGWFGSPPLPAVEVAGWLSTRVSEAAAAPPV